MVISAFVEDVCRIARCYSIRTLP